MNRVLVFFLGVITGGILTIFLLGGLAAVYVYSATDNNDLKEGKYDPKITLAEQKTEFLVAKRFEVYQVLDDGALAHCEDTKHPSVVTFYGPLVYILSDGQNMFYDEQIIKVPKGKKAIQIGTYRYFSKVVPVIEFQ